MGVISAGEARLPDGPGAVGDAPADPLVCPQTKLPLHPCSLEHAEHVMGGGDRLGTRLGSGPDPVGPTSTVLLRADNRCAYPVIDGIPVLLAPERLVPSTERFTVDLGSARYAEAYEEMDFYSSEAERAGTVLDEGPALRRLLRAGRVASDQRRAFPAPAHLWLDSTYEAAAQWDAYRLLAPLDGKRVLQVGGKGLQAVTLLLAGAAQAWVVSPMVSELVYAAALARRVGVASRLRCVAGLGEELPFAAGEFNGLYTISTHHMVTEIAFSEFARVLRPGGALAAVEPWGAPLYRLGTAVLGKRQPQVHCRPLTRARVQPFFECFENAAVVQHGTLLRYPMLALWKLGIKLPLWAALRVTRVDDAVASLVPGLRRWGSCAALLGSAPG